MALSLRAKPSQAKPSQAKPSQITLIIRWINPLIAKGGISEIINAFSGLKSRGRRFFLFQFFCYGAEKLRKEDM
jgi:hypothetical protein